MIFLSIIIPAYNASTSISTALKSVFLPCANKNDFSLEVLVINDGSDDALELRDACAKFPLVKTINHQINRGASAARNTGIFASEGEYVILLDADDELVSNWPNTFQRILSNWPEESFVCFANCINTRGKRTCSDPEYDGCLTAEDMVNQKYMGEYLPIFRGNSIRCSGYDDLGTRRECGLLSYMRMAKKSPIWISHEVMRIYHDVVDGSISQHWWQPDKSNELFICFSKILDKYGDFYKKINERNYKKMQCKNIVYRMLALRGRDYRLLWKNRFFSLYWIMCAFLLCAGVKISIFILRIAKSLSILRRYG